MILLETDLLVLNAGVLEGRKVFANILKYIRMGASSNFGNMFSVVGASIFLPYVPMIPIQILTNNLLYDFSQVPIPADDVDPEQIARPRPWSMNAISRFILFIGTCSSIFDYTTFLMMWLIFQCGSEDLHCPEALLTQMNALAESLGVTADFAYRMCFFQTGWFVESLLTQTLIIHVIRTNRIPFLQSWASWPLLVTTAIIMLVGALLPYSPLGPAFGFTPLPCSTGPSCCDFAWLCVVDPGGSNSFAWTGFAVRARATGRIANYLNKWNARNRHRHCRGGCMNDQTPCA